MCETRRFCLAVAALSVFLQGCALSSSSQDQKSTIGESPVPELHLNLPDQPDASCMCSDTETADYNLLEKGFRALNAGDHKEAVNYFRRYQRLEGSAVVDWEAEIAVAYDKMFPNSPYYNSKAASESYHRLKREQPETVDIHQTIILMRDALAIFVALHEKIDDEQNRIDELAETLEKREEALKRLRELTLGQ
ncbi:MAG: hypothetical protein HRT77_07000 [Halioglobus sp.]|nr:hypothetical protein [Halioglobus sp.]